MSIFSRDIWSGVIRDIYTNDLLAAQGARHAQLGLMVGFAQPMAMVLHRFQGDVVVWAQRDVIEHRSSNMAQVEELERVLKWCIQGMREITTSEAIEAAERRRCDRYYRPHPQWLLDQEGFTL